MSLNYHFDRAVASENANPQGLPADFLAGMEARIRANPDEFPAIAPLIAHDEEAGCECDNCQHRAYDNQQEMLDS